MVVGIMGENNNPSFLFGDESLPHSDHDMPFLFADDSGAGSEEGFDLPEEPVRRAPHRSSGSKRSRAAEVHNLSEKRRRSRINEKMKALQNLIPNSNKTDKASMLDEAIDYLKQLQLQVQMLSMRNGLTSLPMYLPGALPPLQASQLCMSLGDSTSAMNMGVLGLLPLNQDPSAMNSFDLTTQSTSSHRTVILPLANICAPETSFSLEASQHHHRPFQLGLPHQVLFAEDAPQQQFNSPRTRRNLSESAMKSMAVVSSLHFEGQTSSRVLEDHNPLDNVLPKDLPDSNPIFSEHFDGLQTETSFTKSDTKLKGLDI